MGKTALNKKIINGLEYLEQNYRPSDIQKLLDNSKTKREVYQGLKVSEYGLNKYIKHYIGLNGATGQLDLDDLRMTPVPR